MYISPIKYFIIGFFVVGCSLPNERDIPTSIEQAWKSHPERIRSLIGALSFGSDNLKEVAENLFQEDTVAACISLLKYYQRVDRSWVIEAIDPLTDSASQAITHYFLNDSVIIHDVAAKIPVGTDGGWIWNHLGPENDAEFAYSLNSQSYLAALLVAWQKTRDSKIVEIYDRIISDWVVQHPLPQEGDSIFMVLNNVNNLDYRDIGEVEWRTLDTGRRLGASWPQTFYGFLKDARFSPATRLLMLSSINDQANYLQQYHKSGHNWTTMEMNGLALVGLAFPEFKNAGQWVDYAYQIMSGEINRQVYPDGVQTEISTKTQWVAVRRFESLSRNFINAGRKIPEEYIDRIEDMYNYLAYCMRPDGHQPLNNDSDREDLRPRILRAAKKFDRSDWSFIATNGRAGLLPSRSSSIAFPNAGIQIFRNGWDEDADWTFFDQGPYGTGHQHRDMLHLSISAFGKDLLVDGGRYTHRDYFSFDPSTWRGYFRSSFSHNVILIDGRGQKAGPLRSEKALQDGVDYMHCSELDFATGRFSAGFEEITGQVDHTRSVLYLKDHRWLVVDRVETDRPRDVTVLWHFAPSSTVEIQDGTSLTKNLDGPNLQLKPLSNVLWDVQLVKGQEKPFIQGWYSADYGKKVPNCTVEYKLKIDGAQNFAWLMIASDGVAKDVQSTSEFTRNYLNLSYEIDGSKIKEINFPLSHEVSDIQIK